MSIRQVFTDNMKRRQIWLPARDVAEEAGNLKQNNVYVFDGTNDVISMGDNFNLHAGDFTISFWMYSENYGADGVLIGKGENSNTGWYFEYYQNRIYATTGNPLRRTITANNTLSNYKWHHMTFVREAASIKIYINGAESAYTDSADHTTISPSAHNFTVGAYPAGQILKHNGKISMIQIFDAALLPAQVVQLYKWENLTTNRVGFFKCAEGAGLVSIDEMETANGDITTDNAATFHSTDDTILAAIYETFEGYSVDYDMTVGDWTHSPYAMENGTFWVSIGKYGKILCTIGNWAGGFIYDGAGADTWTDYEVTFDVNSYPSGRFHFGFRMGAVAGYWMQCLPGTVNESTVGRGDRNFLDNWTVISYQTSPAPVTSVKIRIVGTSIKVYYNGSDTPTHDITDATYAAGTIGVSGFTSGWKVDNIVVTEL